jgi:hypothetical protein
MRRAPRCLSVSDGSTVRAASAALFVRCAAIVMLLIGNMSKQIVHWIDGTRAKGAARHNQDTLPATGVLKVKRESEVMHGQTNGSNSESEVIPFSRAEGTSTCGGADQLDKAGQTILQMLHRAAGVAEENSRHALETAQKLSHQLRAAEDRIAELEAEVTAHQDRAERAEQWLHRVYTEIEERFLQQTDSRGAMNGAPQRPQNARRSR